MQKLALLLVLVLVGVAAVFLWRFTDDGQDGLVRGGADRSAAADAERRDGSAARRHRDGEVPEAPMPAEEAATGGAEAPGRSGLRGVLVKRSDGSVLAGIEARLVAADGSVLVRTGSDDEGRFVLAVAGERPAGRFEAAGAGFALEPRAIPAGPADDWLDLGRLELDPAVVVSGRVLDATRKPIAGATVELFAHDKMDMTRWDLVKVFQSVFREDVAAAATTTDEKGVFRFEEIAARSWLILATAEGHARRFSGNIEARPGTPIDVELVLGEARGLKGFVKDERGDPIADVLLVALIQPDGAEIIMRGFRTRSDEKGAFAFDRLPGDHVQLMARRSGLVAREAKFVGLPAEEPIEIVMGPAGHVTGRVYDRRTDEGIAGVEVIGLQWQSGSFELAITDDEGRYRLDDLPRQGELYLVARKEGYSLPDDGGEDRGMFGMPGLTLGSAELAGGEAVKDIPMVGGTRITGRVYDGKTGEGIAGARVRYVGQGAFFGVAKASNTETLTDEQGRYELSGAPPGGFTVTAMAPGFFQPKGEDDESAFDFFGGSTGRQRKLVAGQTLTDVDVVLERGVTVSGRVLGSDEKPRPGAKVVWYPLEQDVLSGFSFLNAEAHQAVADGEGRFAFGGLPAGVKLMVMAQHKDYPAAARVEVTPGPEGRTDLVVRLEAGGAVRGRLLHESGAAAEGFVLRVHPEGDFVDFGWGMNLGGGWEPGPSVTTDANGFFLFESLPAGEVTVTLETEGDEILRPDSQVLRVRSGVESRQDLHLMMTAAIAGRVVDEAGKPVPEASIMAAAVGEAPPGDDLGRMAWAESDDEGYFRLPGLRSDLSYNLRAEVWSMPEPKPGQSDEELEMVRSRVGVAEGVPGGAVDLVIVAKPVPKEAEERR